MPSIKQHYKEASNWFSLGAVSRSNFSAQTHADEKIFRVPFPQAEPEGHGYTCQLWRFSAAHSFPHRPQLGETLRLLSSTLALPYPPWITQLSSTRCVLSHIYSCGALFLPLCMEIKRPNNPYSTVWVSPWKMGVALAAGSHQQLRAH